ncbi:MAG: hypothetical protein JWM11_2082, partial [Planctomycetaceae bacterium]|nr:hypothetical protein [Planctomycetaceae bacterium]
MPDQYQLDFLRIVYCQQVPGVRFTKGEQEFGRSPVFRELRHVFAEHEVAVIPQTRLLFLFVGEIACLIRAIREYHFIA